MKDVYVSIDWDSTDSFLETLRRHCPGESLEWESIRVTTNKADADYHVALNQPPDDLDPERLLLFCRETPWNDRCSWEGIDALARYPPSENLIVQLWWVDRSYDFLSELSAEDVEKTKDLSWITTDKGKNDRRSIRWLRKAMFAAGYRRHQQKPFHILNRGGTDGHLFRYDFLERLVESCPDIVDLYGRGDFSGPHYCGEIEDKWDGLAQYRYSLAIENYQGPNYISEKLVDPLLSWCMPIYWGCTNLEEYLPADSFVEIDITDPDAPQRVREIVQSDIREQNLDAIAEARRRILDEYQIWPMMHRRIEALKQQGGGPA